MGIHVVSYSLFGSNSFYLEGAVENAKACLQHYPSWQCRIYYSRSTVPNDTLTKLSRLGVKLIAMPQRGRFDGLAWRFLPLNDSDVDIWICRDADSRLSRRERAAVDEWLASGRCGHVMRDHPAHTSAIMGGMFGIDNRRLCRQGSVPDVGDAIARWCSAQDYKGFDQHWLRDHLWPLICHDHVAHDPMSHFRTGRERPFPVPPAPGECRFVGERIQVRSPLFRSSSSSRSAAPVIIPLQRRLRSSIRRPRP